MPRRSYFDFGRTYNRAAYALKKQLSKSFKINHLEIVKIVKNRRKQRCFFMAHWPFGGLIGLSTNGYY